MAHIPYGYRIENGKAVLDETKAEQIRVLFEEYVSGSSLVSARIKTGIGKNHSSIGRMIDKPIYMGDDFYPAIVDKEIWNKAHEERRRRAEALGRDRNYFAKDKKGISPFMGKVFCSECGSEYRRYSNNGKERWKCSWRIVAGKLYCNSPMIPEKELESAFMRIVQRIDILEITKMSETKKRKIEQRHDDPFKQAEYAYSQTDIDDFEFQTKKLLAALHDIPEDFSGEFMMQIIKRIEVSHKGTAAFVLINDKIFREELEIDGKA